jgi:AraC-like DNA-binding protein
VNGREDLASAPTDVTIDGPRTRRWRLPATAWPTLMTHRISRLGIEYAVAPYARARVNPSGSFLMVCLSGKGRVRLDDHWQTLGPGEACMAPPRVRNAFLALPGQTWSFAWIRFDEPSPVRPVVSAASPRRVRAPAADWARLLEGLRAEWESGRDPKVLHHWLELLILHVRRLAGPAALDDRLVRLWEEVQSRLGEFWNLNSLARAFHSSPENLRRLCLRYYGRSPMQHVTHMRMRLAQELLENGDDKLETIAAQVGYSDALVLSRTFKRVVGCPPSEYRRRRPGRS